MKLKGLRVDVKTGKIEEVFEEISDEEYQKRLEEAQRQIEQQRIKELIEKKKQEILERQATEELIKEGKIDVTYLNKNET